MIPDNVKNLFRDLNEKDIIYVHWKSNEHILEGLMGKTDLDVLIPENQHDQVVECLKDNGYVMTVSMKWQLYPFVEDWIGFCSNTGIQTHIHLHMRLITGKPYVKEQYLPFDAEILQSRMLSELDVYVADPNLEIIILLIRTVIKQSVFSTILNNNGEFLFSKNVKREYEYLKKIVERDCINKFSSETLPGHEELIESIIFEKCTNKRMLELKNIVNKEFEAYRRCNYISAVCLSTFRYYYIKLRSILKIALNTKKTLASQKGLIITFIGVDGSGKSTISKKVQNDLNWKIDSRYFYLGSGDGSTSILNRLLRRYAIAKKSLSNVDSTHVISKNNNPTHKCGAHGLKLLISNLNSVSNAKAKYKACKKMDTIRHNGGIAITDRYPQIQFIGINDGPHIVNLGSGLFALINKWLKKKEYEYLEKACSYKPDIIIKLSIPFEVSRARKKDSSEESIKRKIEIIDSIHFDGSREYIVDNTGELEGTLLKVKNIIWDEIKRIS